MIAIGLFVLRLLIARPLVRRVPGASLRALEGALAATVVLGLVAVPAYLEEATAIDSLRSFFAFGTLVPLWRTTAFGRGYVDLEICFALFAVAAAVAVWLDRPEREERSVGALLSLAGALAAAVACLAVPGISGHAAQTAPRGFTVLFDLVHLSSGAVWLGGLVGVLVLWRSLPAARRLDGLVAVVPRFSAVAFVAVLALIGSGIDESIVHLPILAALWQTGYGKAILVKIAILVVAAALGAVNFLHTVPSLEGVEAERAARLLRRVVSVEALLVAGAIFAAAVLSSLAPPPPAFAQESSAIATVGPGRAARTLEVDGYTLRVVVAPNKAVTSNSFELDLSRGGTPVRGADVTLGFDMLEMQMPHQEYQLTETQPGVYVRKAPALVMVGNWSLQFTITPKGGAPFTALVVDRAAS
jgi:copper transport protein